MNLTDFERLVMTALLAGDHPSFEELRSQMASATVERREEREGGFVAFLSATAGKSVDDIQVIDDLQVQLEGAQTPADAVLQLENGRLHALECYVYEGEFPEEPRIVAAWYYGTEKFDAIGDELFAARDLEAALEM